MKKILILLLICLVGLEVFASEWAELSDKKYIKIEKYQDGKVFYWVKALNDGRFEPINKKTVNHKMSYFSSNCSNNTMAIISSYSYDMEGNVISNFNDAYYMFEPVVPQSIGETMHKYVCGYQ